MSSSAGRFLFLGLTPCVVQLSAADKLVSAPEEMSPSGRIGVGEVDAAVGVGCFVFCFLVGEVLALGDMFVG